MRYISVREKKKKKIIILKNILINNYFIKLDEFVETSDDPVVDFEWTNSISPLYQILKKAVFSFIKKKKTNVVLLDDCSVLTCGEFLNDAILWKKKSKYGLYW